MLTITADVLKALAYKIFAGLGTPDDLAELMSSSLVGGNLAGHDSHGVMLINSYAAGVRAGAIKPAARAMVEPAGGMLATLSVDGTWGWGPPAAFLATEKLIERANQYGIGAAVVRRCHHIGRVGQYVEQMAAHNLVGIATCNSGNGMVPFNGRQRMLGTNPIAIGIPRPAGQAPVLYDAATSVVAGGKIKVLLDKGLPVPEGWIVDGEGRPSTLASDFFTGGALLPLGGHKGYGLGVMVELLAGLLSGASAAFLPDFVDGNGVLLMAFRPDAFMPLDAYLAKVELACATLKASPPVEGVSEVLVPGDTEQRARRERGANGIPMAEATWEALTGLAGELGVAG